MKVLWICFLLIAVAAAKDLRENFFALNSTDSIDGRIINGHKAAANQFPYQVGLMVRVLLGSSWCGGSLIDNQWILTAAHCLTSARSVTVYLGATQRLRAAETIVVPRENLFYHADFNRQTAQNDIGLIKLPNPVQLSRRIQLVDLPLSTDKTHDLTDQAVVSTGWGIVTDDSSVSNDLQYVTMTISDAENCEEVYGSASFTENNICIRTDIDNTSTCQGDSGGPIVLTLEGIQVGIVSYGSNQGCESGYPIAFTRVASFIDWINETTGLNLE